MDVSALLPLPATWPRHTIRSSRLRSSLAAEVQFQAYGRGWHATLTRLLLDAVPEWRTADTAYTEWRNATSAVKDMHALLQRAQSEQRSLQDTLQAALADITALPPLGTDERQLGYRAGLEAAQLSITHRLQQRAVPGDRPFLFDLLRRYCTKPPDSPVELPSEADQIARFAAVLRSQLNSASAGLSTVAQRLQLAVAPKIPQPDAYRVAHLQWVLHYETFTNLEDQLDPLLPFVGKGHGPEWVRQELGRLATSLLPSQSDQQAGFAAGFQTASLQAAAVLRSRARRLR